MLVLSVNDVNDLCAYLKGTRFRTHIEDEINFLDSLSYRCALELEDFDSTQYYLNRMTEHDALSVIC